MIFSKKFLHAVFILLCYFVFFSACTPTHYGVPEEEWLAMGVTERATTIKEYDERQRVRAENRRIEAERREAEEKRLAAIAEQERRERDAYIQSIYDGERGQLGDLVRVSLKGGKMRFPRKHHHFRPFSFKIADQECKTIEFAREKKKSHSRGKLQACYEGGTLLIDVAGRGQDYGAEAIVYDPKWIKGANYTLHTDGRAELKNVGVSVVVIKPRRHSGRRKW